MGLHFFAFWPCGPSFPCILALRAFISFHFGLFGVSVWGPPPQVAKNGPFAQRPYNGFISAVTGSILQFLAFWAFISLRFGLCGPSFPCILALWAFISLHFGLVGFHFLAFWPCGPSFPFILAFSGPASGVLPQVAKNGPLAQRPYNGFISAVTGPILQFLAFWAFISLHFGLVGLHFLSFWPFGPSFPFILALWAFISLHFGLVGIHFLSFWHFRGRLSGSLPQVAKNGPFAQRPYNGFISAVTGPILQFLAFWAYISLHFGLVGLHFLAFWPCGPSFPCILALWAFISLHFGLVGLHFLSFWPFRGRLLGPPPQVAKNGPFAQRPYNGFISTVTGPILQFLAFWAFISLHFGLVGLHFLAFWPCGPSFPCILALWAFISFHFGLFGVGFWAPPPQVAKNGPFAQRPYNGFISAVTGPILQFLAFWAFISLHFGLVGLHFLAFWPCGPSFPCNLALWAFISLHFGLFGVGFWGPPHKLPKTARFPNVPYKEFSSARPGLIFQFLGLHLAFGSTLVKATLVSIYMCMQVCIMSVQFQRFTCIQNCANKNWRPISPDPGQRKPTPLRNPRSTPKKVKKLKQVFSIVIARACSTLVKATLLRMYTRMCM